VPEDVEDHSSGHGTSAKEWATLEGRLYLEKMRDEERMGQGIKSEERANDSEE
jgi:hypothetical protein